VCVYVFHARALVHSLQLDQPAKDLFECNTSVYSAPRTPELSTHAVRREYMSRIDTPCYVQCSGRGWGYSSGAPASGPCCDYQYRYCGYSRISVPWVQLAVPSLRLSVPLLRVLTVPPRAQRATEAATAEYWGYR
jgi:hypothetical protein